MHMTICCTYRLILRADAKATAALNGLVHMEDLRAHLILKGKDLELIGLNKIMAGDKSAEHVLRKLTPKFSEKAKTEWSQASNFAKSRIVFGVGCVVVMMVTKIVKAFLTGTLIGDALIFMLDIVFYVCAVLGGLLVAVYFILKGKPFRDQVLGPAPGGVEL
jgi:hypothetical protein